MTQLLKSYAYRLTQDLERFETLDWEYDLELDQSQISLARGLKVYRTAPLELPVSLKFWAEMSSLIYTDYPYCDYLNGAVMSKRMLEALLTVKPFAHRVYPVEVVDWEMTPPRQFTVADNDDYLIVQLTDYADVFDYEKSVYTKEPYLPPRRNEKGEEEWFASNVREYAFRDFAAGLPPVFRIAESPVDLFISDEARQALKEAKIRGVRYESLKGFSPERISHEIDVPVNHPPDMREREKILRQKLGV